MDWALAGVVAVIAALVAAAAVILASRWLVSNGHQSDDLAERLKQRESEITVLREANSSLEVRAALGERGAEQLQQLEKVAAERDAALAQLRDAKAAVEGELAAANARIEEKSSLAARVTGELGAATSTLDKLRTEHSELQIAHAGLKETLQQLQSQSDEKIALLQDAQQRMTAEFKLLAGEIMRQHGETFSKQNKDQIEAVLTPLREKMLEFQQGLQTAHTESAKERATLTQQIQMLGEMSAKMTQETENLTRALKSDAKTQGVWGEMMLMTILERSGLRKGEEYVCQESHVSEDGARLRPDAIVNLPYEHRIVIDAKVSLTAFERYANAADDADRAANLAQHVTSIRTHIETLGSKAYWQVDGSKVDYVIMFCPIEGALSAALQYDAGITGFATERGVAIATPTTLMIALRTVANVWRVERQNRNAQDIAERAGKLYDKFVGFVGDMKLLGDRLDSAKSSYSAALTKLSSGPGNLVRQTEMLKQLGAATKKSIPSELLDDNLVEMLPAASVDMSSTAATD